MCQAPGGRFSQCPLHTWPWRRRTKENLPGAGVRRAEPGRLRNKSVPSQWLKEVQDQRYQQGKDPQVPWPTAFQNYQDQSCLPWPLFFLCLKGSVCFGSRLSVPLQPLPIASGPVETEHFLLDHSFGTKRSHVWTDKDSTAHRWDSGLRAAINGCTGCFGVHPP